MILIPGFLIQIATFPGVIVHEIAHQLFCRMTGTAVFDVCYFRVGNPAGYVIHERASTPGKQLLISIAPFFINTILGALIAAPSAIAVFTFSAGNPLDALLIWLGVSIAMHAFPSTGDAKSLWVTFKERGTPWYLKALVFPIIVVICLGAIGSIIWLDVIYGVTVAAGLPWLIIQAML
jgi:hypothetical protein